MRRIVRKVFFLTYKEKTFTYLADDEEGEVVGDPCGQLPLHHLLQPAVPGQHHEALNEITFSKWKENHATKISWPVGILNETRSEGLLSVR